MPSSMCYFAHFGLMINSDFPSKCVIFHAWYWSNLSNYCLIPWFDWKMWVLNYLEQKIFLKKRAGNSNFLRLKIGDFWMGLTGHGQARTHFWKKFWEAQIPNFLALWAPRPVFARFWPFLRPQIWWFLAFLRHFWPLKMVVSSHTGNES